jgi:hypothetical protein
MDNTKQANDGFDPQRITDAKGLGFVSALQTAGVEDARIQELYPTYLGLDQKREATLRDTYAALVQKED